jgi:TBP-interacting protein
MARRRGTEIESPHGVPLDFIDRSLIITTRPYTKEEIRKILEIRMAEEKIKMEDDALEYLTEIGEKTSLRYAVQLMAPAHNIAGGNKKKKIGIEDIKEAEMLFADVKRSMKYLKEHEKIML